jgi:hypothetical protein
MGRAERSEGGALEAEDKEEPDEAKVRGQKMNTKRRPGKASARGRLCRRADLFERAQAGLWEQ